MPIGNQAIWDKGIGAGATNVVFGQQPQQTNFNPGALGADPTQQPAIAATAQPTQQAQTNEVANIMVNGKLMTMTEYQEYVKKTMSPEQYQSYISQGKKPATMAFGYDKDGNQVGGVKSNPNNPKLQTGWGKLMSG